jgi:hypothetical protein
MKKSSRFNPLNSKGVLRWSTVLILAGGAASLTGCDRGVRYVATEKDVEMAAAQSEIEKLDAAKSKLSNGEVANNFHIPGVGYYHAEAREFFEHPYGFSQEGRWFINGVWRNENVAEALAVSRPSPEALKKVEAALEKEQKEQKVATNSNSSGSQSHGFGIGNTLMMYWLLSGNRGFFSPGAGFTQASSQAGNWQRGVDSQRSAVGSYAAANPGYQRMVAQSRASGMTVKSGESLRGGFGASRSSSSIGSSRPSFGS